MNDETKGTLLFLVISVALLLAVYALLLQILAALSSLLQIAFSFLVIIAALAFYEVFLGDLVADWKYRWGK